MPYKYIIFALTLIGAQTIIAATDTPTETQTATPIPCISQNLGYTVTAGTYYATITVDYQNGTRQTRVQKLVIGP